MTGSRTVRVFLSSTFRDFAEERDLLVRKVFPELRRKCRERQVELVDVDLRWGITEKEAQQGKVLPICLAEIDRSRPFFMGFIGERYGWVPEKDQYDLSLVLEQPWLDKHRGGKSVTELEMLHGVLNNPAMEDRAFFYFRDPKWSKKKGGAYLSEGTAEKAKLEILKERIRKSQFPVVESYRTPEILAERVRQDLWKLIDEAFPKNEVLDPLGIERNRHAAYTAARCRMYLGGQRYLKTLNDAIRANPYRPVLITGHSGAGKSALIANWVAGLSKMHPKKELIVHHLGCGADAADPVRMATRIVQEIARITGDEFKAESDPEKQLEQLPVWLSMASAWAQRSKKELVVVLDGLDKVSERKHLGWFPTFLPPGVKFVVSCLDGDILDAARPCLEWLEVEVIPFTKGEQSRFIREYLGRYRKSLSAHQAKLLQAHPLSGNPLFLVTVLEELRVFGVHEQLEKHLRKLLSTPASKKQGEVPSVDDVFEHVLERVECDVGKRAVQAAAEAIWASRDGLFNDELLSIARLAPAQWAAIHNSLDESLYESSGKVNFGHDYLKKAVEDRYGLTGKLKIKLHRRLAGWFASKSMSARVARELPWQLREAKNVRDLKRRMLDHSLFQELLSADRYELLEYWLGFKTANFGKEYEAVWRRWCRQVGNPLGIADVAESLGTFLSETGCYTPFTHKLLRSSLKCKARHFGARSFLALRARLGLADLLKDSGELAESEIHYRSLLQDAKSRSAKVRILFREAQNNLGLLLAERGSHDEAEKLLKACFKIHRDSFGDRHPRTLGTINNLGILAESRGEFAEAREYYRRAYEGMAARRGALHPEALLTLGNIASMSDVLGDVGEARMLYNKTRSGLTKVLGPAHPFTVNTVNNLACLEFGCGDAATAGKLFADVVNTYRRTLNQKHPLLLKAIDNLGHVHFSAGELRLALVNFRESYAGRREVFGPNHGDTETSRYNLALSLKKIGEVADAKSVLVEDGTSPDAKHNYLLARFECVLGHHDEAKKYLNKALALDPDLRSKALQEEDLRPVLDVQPQSQVSSLSNKI